MRFATTILMLSFVLPALTSGGEALRDVVIAETRIASAIVVDPLSGRLQLRHDNAARSVVDSSRRVLAYAVYVPSHDEVVVAKCMPENLRRFVTIVPAGSYGGRPLVHVEVDVLGHCAATGGRLGAFEVRLSAPGVIKTDAALQPPVGPRVVNHGWEFSQKHRTTKGASGVQNVADPAAWYHQARGFVRIETRNDGVAMVMADQVLPLSAFGSIDSMALFWRGLQQPMYVDDADGSTTLSSGDVIYFLGRRAAGDTSFLDENDSTSVFYLTGTFAGSITERFRRRGATDVLVDSTVSWLDMHRRFEHDTGYFHPGNGIDDDHGKLYTPRAALEGFYWSLLNARTQQANRYSIPFIPARGSIVEVAADVVTTLNSSVYDPDHALDVMFPGADAAYRFEVDGVGRHVIRDSIPADSYPPVIADLFLQATGFPERLTSTNWVSLILVDGFDVQGKGAAIMQEGRLIGRMDHTRPVALSISNAPAASSVVLDTIAHEIIFTQSDRKAHVIRASVWAYRDPSRPLLTQPGRYSLGVSIGELTRRDDSITTFATVRLVQAPPRLEIQRYDNASDLAAAIQGADPKEPLVVINLADAANAVILSALSQRGFNPDVSVYPRGWIASFGPDAATISAPMSHVAEYTASTGSSYAMTVHFSSDSHAVVIGSGPGIERAGVQAATNAFLSKHDWTLGTDVIAIVHRDLMQQARRWAAHREAFSKVRVALFDVESIFEAYDCGRHTPNAIRAFLQDAWKRSTGRKPTHCVLIGNASWDVRQAVKAGNVDARRPDRVPTYGRPTSDFWYGLLDDDKDLVTPELIVTRLPALTDAELKILVDKIIVADTVPFAPYQRRFLYAGGGKPEENFCEVFDRILRDEFGSGIDFSAPPLCIDTIVVCKEFVTQPGRLIRSQINEGVGLINFFGHGGTEMFDIEDWAPPQLANEGKYPILATFSCLTGGYASPSAMCENAKYLFEPRHGVAAAVGSTGLQYIAIADFLLYRFHEVLENTNIRSVGALTYEAKRSMALLNTTFGNNAAHQFAVLGDPFTRLRIDTAVEVSIPLRGVRVSTRRSVDPIIETDSTVFIDVDIWSEGLGTVQPFDVQLLRTYQGTTDTFIVPISQGICRQGAVRFELPVTGMPGRHDLVITVDPEGVLNDRTANNSISLPVDVANPSLLILEPETGRVVNPDSIVVRVIDVISTSSVAVPVTMALCATRDTASWVVRSRPEDLARIAGTALIDWKVPSAKNLDTTRTYWIGAWPELPENGVPVAVRWHSISLSSAPVAATHHRLRADELRDAAPAGSFDTASRTLVMPLLPVPLSVRSAGTPTSDPVREPYMSFTLRDSLLLENSFRRGLNIMVFSVYDSLPRIVRRYDTSPNGSPISAGHNGYASECIEFLRDSVKSEDIVAVAACDESFTRFQRDGLFDDLRALLNLYGATMTDSLDVSSSYAFIGSRGYKRLPIAERVSRTGGVVVATAEIPFTWDTLRIPIENLAVRQWQGISARYRGDVRIRVSRRDKTGNVDTVVIRGDWNADKEFSYIPHHVELFATDTVPLPEFSAADLYYTPLPQIVAIAVSPVPTDVMRGDSMIVEATIFNARFSSDTIDVPLRVIIRDGAGAIRSVDESTVRVNPDTSAVYRASIPAQGAAGRILLELVVDPELRAQMRHRVMYRAVGSGSVFEDGIRPTVELYADGSIRRDGMAVGVNPLLEILLLDNSKLPIESPDNLVVFVNGSRIRPDNVQDWQFIGSQQLATLMPGRTNARAKLAFRFPMESGQNLVIIRSRDATGNPDTTEISLIRPSDGYIADLVIYPNPALPGSARLILDVALAGERGSARIAAYDVQARRTDLGSFGVATGRYEVALERDETILLPGFYTLVVELIDEGGKTLSTATKKLVVMP